LSRDELLALKKKGFSDRRLARQLKTTDKVIREKRHALGIRPVYKRVDTCAAEFATNTAYMYSTYEDECEAEPTNNKKIMVLGGGPNRIGQGIEFDYCCVHAALAMREDGYETIMVNCNPETVSTDYDTSDRLYFEPLTLEDVLEIVDKEKPLGVIVQYGGQTPLKLALGLEAEGVPIIGTSPDMIDAAEDRERFSALLRELNLKQPPNATARTEAEALEKAASLGYPLVVRPSYVLGGRAMEIVHEQRDLERYMREAVKVSNDSPVLLDRFLNDAIECDVDCLRDPTGVTFIGGVMEHIEQAGVHSGDSACSLPPYYLSKATVNELKRQSAAMAGALNVVGLMNVQFAIQEVDGKDVIYVLEVNPRASRTVPFVSKATGIQLAKVAARCMAGQSLASQGITKEVTPPYFSVKEAVFPFVKFPGVDTILGPEMKSTGEVMGVGKTFGEAFVKSQLGAGTKLPRTDGKVFLTVKNGDKPRAVEVARQLHAMGFELVATKGTAAAISRRRGLPVHGEQGHRRPPARGGHDQEQRDCAGHQHRGRAPQCDCRLAGHPHLGAAGAGDDVHHHRGCRSCRRRHEIHGPPGCDFGAGNARPTRGLTGATLADNPRPDTAWRQRPAVSFCVLTTEHDKRGHHSHHQTRRRKAQGRAARAQDRAASLGHQRHCRSARPG
jgi:carbamoyl-phosphate synthase large subunit